MASESLAININKGSVEMVQGIESQSNSTQAEQLFQEGEELLQQRTVFAQVEATKKWEEALSVWQKTGNEDKTALTLTKLGSLYQELGAITLALERYEEALPFYQQQGKRLQEAIILGRIGELYKLKLKQREEQGRVGSSHGFQVTSNWSESLSKKSYDDRDKAEEFSTQAEELYQALNQSETATFASKQAYAQYLIRTAPEYDYEGETVLQKALAISQEIDDSLGEANAFQSLSQVYLIGGAGSDQTGWEFFNQAREIYQKIAETSEENYFLARQGEAELLRIAVRYWWGDNTKKSLEFHEQALKLYREIGDLQGEASTLKKLGRYYSGGKKLELYHQALKVYQESGDLVEQADILDRLGINYSFLENRKKALELYHQKLDILKEIEQFYRQLGDNPQGLYFAHRQPIVLGILGKFYGQLEDREQELEQYRQGREFYRSYNDHQGEANFLLQIAERYGYLERQQERDDFVNQAVAVYRDVGDSLGEAELLREQIASLYLYRFNETEKGIESLKQALKIYQEIDNLDGEVRTLDRLGRVYTETLENKEQGLSFYQQTIPLYQELGESRDAAYNLRIIGKLHYELGNQEAALVAFNQAANVYQEQGDLEQQARVLRGIGQDYLELEDRAQTIEFYQRAIGVYQRLGDYRKEAGYLRSIGKLYYELEQVDRAIETFNQARQVYNDNGDRSGEAWTVYATGKSYSTLGDLERALEAYHQSLLLYEQEPKAPAVQKTMVDILISISQIYSYLGDSVNARESCQKSLATAQEFWTDQTKNAFNIERFRKIGRICYQVEDLDSALGAFEEYWQHYQQIGKSQEILGSIRVGEDYLELGDAEQALVFFKRAQAIYQESDFKEGELRILGWIGSIHSNSGEYQKSLEFYNQVIHLTQQLKNPEQEAEYLLRISNVYAELGDLEQALSFTQKALKIYKELENIRGEIDSLKRLGELYEQLEDLEKAIEYYQKSIGISQENGAPSGNYFYNFQKVGRLYYQIGNLEQALAIFNQALENAPTNPDAYTDLGKVYSDLGNLDRALELFNKALKFSDRDEENQAENWFGLAVVERQRGNLDIALNHIEKAITLIENIRDKKTSQEERQSFFTSKQDYYEFYIDLLIELHQQNPSQGYDAQAFNINERSRARSLLDLLSEANTDIRKGVDPDLVIQERRLQQQLDTIEQRRVELYQNEYTLEEKAEIEQERQYLLNKYEKLQTEIREKSPSYAALTQPEPVTLPEIQQNILDEDTVILQYFLGEKRSVLWAITQNRLTSYILPPRQEIEKAAIKFRYFLGHPNHRHHPEKAIAAGEALNSLILPLSPEKLSQKRLVIVADGALHYIPFSALPLPGTAQQNNFTRLSDRYELVNLPSVSTLAILRQEMRQRQTAPQQLAILADPVFSPEDQRLQDTLIVPNSPIANPILTSVLPRTARESEIELNRLPGTRSEAEAIMAMVPESQRIHAFDFTANHTFATNPQLNQYRIIHFATHGILNSKNPELSGLVLSLLDQQGNPSNGFLRLHDVFNLDLSADLVVLSACQTGLGKEIRGEGLVGLTRGFMYAGTPRVLVSLWSVDDAATAEMMTRFYRLMLQEGLSPTESLKQAQREMQTETQWKEPFYWAAFTLQGEWE